MQNENTVPVSQDMPSQPDVKSVYQLKNFINKDVSQGVQFVKMLPDGSYEDGTTLEEMLNVSIERLTHLNSAYPCRENSIAITKMQEALMWLNARTEDRVARGVEGTHAA